jgi:hypothetical protein
VHAIAEGEIVMAADDTVMIRHVAHADIVRGGRPVRRWYSVYAPVRMRGGHGRGAIVRKGEEIGTLLGDRLHLDTLVGNIADGARDGAPVSPFRFLPYADGRTLSARVVSSAPLTIEVDVDAASPVLDEVRVKSGAVTSVVRFDDRTGFESDAFGAVVPADARIIVRRNESGNVITYAFVFDDIGEFDNVLVRDIWGRGVALEP